MTPARKRWALVALLVLCALPMQALAKAVISEMMWMGSDLSTSDEWLELAGLGSGTLATDSIAGWQLSYINSSGVETPFFTFPLGAAIGSGQYLVVSHFDADHSRLLSPPAYVAPSISLLNSKLLVRLRNGNGLVVDEAGSASVSTPFAGSNPSNGIKASMERKSLSGSGGLKSNWQTAITFRGFDSGALVLGTPGFANGSVDPVSSSSLASSSVASSSPSSLSSASASSASSAMSAASSSTETSSLFTSSDAASSLGSSSVSSSSSLPEQSSQTGASSAGSSSVSSSFFSSSDIQLQPFIEPQSNSSSSQGSSSLSSFSSSSEAPPPVKITEVYPSPASQKEDTWVELANIGSGAVDISGWFLQGGDSSKIFTIPVRDNSGYVLAPGQYASFHKLQTGLSLSRTGGNVVLRRVTQVVDSLHYPSLPSGVSFGTDRTGSGGLQSYCAPTEGQSNGSIDWNPSLTIQSGTLQSENKVTMNVEVATGSGMTAPTKCSVDFGDGTGVESCNPPSHSFTRIGSSNILATISNYCGTTVTRSLTAQVLAPAAPVVTANVTYTSVVTTPSASSSSSSPSQKASCTPSTFSGVLINEFLPKPSAGSSEWIELLNSSDRQADLCGWFLDDGEKGSRPFSLQNYAIPAGGLLVIDSSESKIGLNDSGDHVRLFAPTVTTEETPSISNIKLVQDISYTKAKDNQSYSRGSNGDFTWAVPTPGETNFQAARRVRALVTHVVDGDTIDVQYDAGQDTAGLSTRIRFLGVDAPELHVNGILNPDGIKSADYIRSLIGNKKIELEFDTNLFDVYGRTLAYLYLDGVSVQKDLLLKGLAIAYVKYPFSKKDEYLGYEQQAKIAHVGLWSNGTVPIDTGSFLDVPTIESRGSELGTSSSSALPGSGSLVISEIYPSPTKSGSLLDRQEWIELYNNSDQDFSLRGVTFDDSEGGGSKPFQFEGDLVIPSGQYAVLTKSMTHIALNNGGDEVRLIGADGKLLDDMRYPKINVGYSYSLLEEQNTEHKFCITDVPTPGEANECAEAQATTKKIGAASGTVTGRKKRTRRSATSPSKKARAKDPVSAIFTPLSEQLQQLGPLGLEGDLLAATGLGESKAGASTLSLPDMLLLMAFTASVSGVAGWAIARKHPND